MVVLTGVKYGLGVKIRKKLTGSSAYGVRGYGAFYYGAGAEVHGIYQVRTRFGHHVQVKEKFYVPGNPQSDPQQSNRLRYANIVAEWQGLTDEQKDYYNNLEKPDGIPGYNRFIHYCFLYPSWPNCPMPNFLELSDTPASYAGQAGKYLLVNAGENALEFDAVVAANKALSNLVNVLVNTHLIPDTDFEWNLGSSTVGWKSLYLRQVYYYNPSNRAQYSLIYKTALGLNFYDTQFKFQYQGHLLTSFTGARNIGSSSKYWANLYIDKIYLNSTAILDGATAGHIKFTGDLVPANDDTEWVGEIGSPFKSIKGLVIKDTTDGKHYKVEVVNGALVVTALD